MIDDRTTYTRCTQRWEALKQERSPWLSHWSEIGGVLLPRSGKFLSGRDSNRGGKRNQKIYDNTATRALRVLAAGMMAGMTSPARPWFRLATADKALMEYGPVKEWLNDVTELMRDIFQRSNTYRSLHQVYEELGAFGTGCSIITGDYRRVIHHTTLTAGEYCIATNHLGEVSTLYRELEMSVASMIERFGRKKCSDSVRNMYDRGQLDSWVTVIHAIDPHQYRDLSKRDNRNMPYMSVYFEAGKGCEEPLSVSGFRRFPAIVPRWFQAAQDIYGSSPAMDALGDINQLQHEQLRKAQAIDYQTKPPLQAPISMQFRDINSLPGGVTFVDGMQTASIKSQFEVNLNLQHLLLDIEDVRDRIRSAFYSDLFLMLANDTRSGITATEIAERHEEKMLMLGPVLERLNNEMLDPMIDIVFAQIVESGLLPPPPQEMQGHEINVQFVSMLAQAQQAVGLSSISRLLGTVGAVAQMQPSALDKLDGDQLIDKASDMLGVDPTLILADDKVAIIRAERAKQQQAMQQAAMMQQGVAMAKQASETDTAQKNALTDVMGMFSGYGGMQ